MQTILAIIAMIGNIKAIFAMIGTAVAGISAWLIKLKVEKKQDEIQKASDELKKANEVTDDTERLKAKAAAACKLEKSIDPSSDCDAP